MLLIADPSLNDYYFSRSVILLAEHDENGSLGLIVNKPTNVKLKELIKIDLPVNPVVMLGGPVATDNIYIMHTLGKHIEGSMEISTGIYWGGDFEHIAAALNKDASLIKFIHFYVGYSGWTAGQLAGEIQANSWVPESIDSTNFSLGHYNNQWRNFMKSLGGEYAVWTNFPANPNLN